VSGVAARSSAVSSGLREKGRLELAYQAVVDIKPRVLQPGGLDIRLLHEIPSEALVFLYPGRFCQSDLLARFPNREFNTIGSGFERVTRICNWTYEYVEYLPGFTNSSTSAYDTPLSEPECTVIMLTWGLPFAVR
jgi:hypothetical protein